MQAPRKLVPKALMIVKIISILKLKLFLGKNELKNEKLGMSTKESKNGVDSTRLVL